MKNYPVKENHFGSVVSEIRRYTHISCYFMIRIYNMYVKYKICLYINNCSLDDHRFIKIAQILYTSSLAVHPTICIFTSESEYLTSIIQLPLCLHHPGYNPCHGLLVHSTFYHHCKYSIVITTPYHQSIHCYHYPQTSYYLSILCIILYINDHFEYLKLVIKC